MIAVHQIQISWRRFQKVGKVWYCCTVVSGRSLFLKLDQSWWQWMNCLEANNQRTLRILKQKIKNQLFSTAGVGTWSLKRWSWRPTSYFFSTLQGKWTIVLAGKKYTWNVTCYMVIRLYVSLSRLLNKWILEMLQIMIWKILSRHS